MRPDRTLVLDIGKTNLKLSLVGSDGAVLAERRAANPPGGTAPYRHFDVDAIWRWMLEAIGGLPDKERIEAIVPATHGAALAVVDDDGLVLPVMDYEDRTIESIDAEYATLRDPYALTGSPSLPGGMNVAKQLVWFEREHARAFARARWILAYAQYWSWRLSGIAAGERTTLGCHSDLWLPSAGDYAPLVDRRGWRPRLPPLYSAFDALGPVRPAVAQATGLPPGCRVLCGIHDNNASMVQHLYRREAGQPLNVVSSGTWVIVAGIGASLDRLDAARDMQALVDAWGRPYACARFMGGREYAALAGEAAEGPVTVADLGRVIEAGVLALPGFADMGGPWGRRKGRIDGSLPSGDDAARRALATLYLALVTDATLGLLQDEDDIVVEGSLTANAAYAGLLAALRPAQRVRLSPDRSGTTGGAWLLARQPSGHAVALRDVEALDVPGLDGYRRRWRDRIAEPAASG